MAFIWWNVRVFSSASVLVSVSAAYSSLGEATDAALEGDRSDSDVVCVVERWALLSARDVPRRDEANSVGMAIIRTARLCSLARGGQVLVSSASRGLTLDQFGDEISLKDRRV